jgi:hypothetical protein
MTNFLHQVATVVRHIDFLSAESFIWCGERISLPRQAKRRQRADTQCETLTRAVQDVLYYNFYCPGYSAPAQVFRDARESPGFLNALVTANRGQGYWSDGWRLLESGKQRAIIEKDGLRLNAPWSSLKEPPQRKGRDGFAWQAHFPKGSSSFSPGFYFSFGENALTSDASDTVRIYWNVTAHGAISLMHLLTSSLNRSGLPFWLKILRSPDAFTRCDAAILYLRKSDFDAASGILSDLYASIARTLRPYTPSLTKVLAPGIGLAEDPGDGSSFGEHRCRLMAEALVQSRDAGHSLESEKTGQIVRRFADEGIAIEKPYLSPDSRDTYRFSVREYPPVTSERRSPKRGVVSSDTDFMDVAIRIGQRLVRSAIWHNGQCTWLGPAEANELASKARETPMREGRISPWGALGPGLYDGTSGIALFLAELYRVTGEARMRDTARGAMTYAFRCTASPVPTDQLDLGVYTGWPGVALAGARVGVALGEEEFLVSAKMFASRAFVDPSERNYELASGCAGAVCGLVALNGYVNDARALDRAIGYADELLRNASDSPRGLSWPSRFKVKSDRRIGFSHGNAGIAFALLELFDVSGERRFRVAAEKALAYERHWFSHEEERQHWDRKSLHRQFRSTWCNGAPGIALTRIRAWEILKEEQYRADAIAALSVTSQAVQSAIRSSRKDLSLCHGLLGNTDILTLGAAHGLTRGCEALVAEAAHSAIDEFGHELVPWPCGTAAGESPGLMVGIAGIGYAYLRLHAATVPSVLMLRCHHPRKPSGCARG